MFSSSSLSADSADLGVYLESLRTLLGQIPAASLQAAQQAIVGAYRRTAQIFVVGNGGSAATATHFACDLSKNTRARGRRPARVMALTDNVAALTAWANDEGYASIFAEQLAGLMRPGDLLVAISGSGNSPNVLAAVEYARTAGMETLALTGRGGGQLGPRVEHALVVPSDSMPLIEDVHLAVCHALTAALGAEIAASAAVETPRPADGQGPAGALAAPAPGAPGS